MLPIEEYPHYLADRTKQLSHYRVSKNFYVISFEIQYKSGIKHH